MMKKIHDGYIGEAYMAKAWYANTRLLDGHRQARPRPRQPQLGSLAGPGAAQRVHGQHPSLQLALAAPLRHRRDAQQRHPRSGRLPLGSCRPSSRTTVTATGGRYQYKDDWQFYDTLVTNFDYPGQDSSPGKAAAARA